MDRARATPRRAFHGILITGIVGGALSVGVYLSLRSQEADHLRHTFETDATNSMVAIERDFERGLQVVLATAAYTTVTETMDRQAFSDFTAPLLQANRSIQAIEWVPFIEHANRQQHESDARAAGFDGYRITEVGPGGTVIAAAERDAYAAVFFVEPLAGNVEALGYDLISEPIRRDGAERAWATDDVAATARITLVQETGSQYGVLLFARARPTGRDLILAVLRIGDIVEDALAPLATRDLEIHLFDQSNPAVPQLLYSTPQLPGLPPTLAELEERPLVANGMLHLGGRDWAIRCLPTPAFLAGHRHIGSAAALTGSLLLTGLLMAYIGGLNKLNERLVNEVSERQRAEAALARSHDELEQRVIDRTALLASQNETLQSEVSDRKTAEARILEYQRELRSFAARLSIAEQHERRRIAVDLHDQIGQTLALTQIKLNGLREKAGAAGLSSDLDSCIDLVNQANTDTRSLITALCPPMLYDLGLDAAVDWLADNFREQHQMNITLNVSDTSCSLDESTRLTMFRSIREVLFNIVKHARADHVIVSLKCLSNVVHAEISDDGVGFDIELTLQHPRPDSLGLFSIREQLEEIGGRIEIRSRAGDGTTVLLEAPIQPC